MVAPMIFGPIFFAFEIIPLALVIGLLVFATKLSGRMRDLQRRLDIQERDTRDLTRMVLALRRRDASDEGQPDAPEASPPKAADMPRQPAMPSLAGSPEPALAAAAPSGDDLAAAAGNGSVPPMPPVSLPAPPPVPPGSAGASLEERIGTRWAVWVGGLALGLGGLLLVRYSIEQGFFGPGARIAMGLAFSALLLVGAEWFRRTGHKPAIDAVPAAHIPSILTAAGTASLFGTIYAAHALYDFIGPALAFVLLGAVGIATMLASAVHGPWLAGLGLAGAYVAPVLVSSQKPSPWPLVIYLAVVAAAAMGLSRMRRWLWLAWLATGGAFLWGLAFLTPMAHGVGDWLAAGYLHALVQVLLAAVFLAVLPSQGTPDRDAEPEPVAGLSLGALVLLAVVMITGSIFAPGATVAFTLASAAVLLATAWLAPRAAVAAPYAGLLVLCTIGAWPGLRSPPDAGNIIGEVAGVLLVPESIVSFLVFAALASLGVAVAAGLRMARGQALPTITTAAFAAAATLTPLLALIFAYLRVTQFDRSISFAFAAGVLGFGYTLAAERFRKVEVAEIPGTRLATGALAAAAVAALSLGLVASLSRGYLTLALALAALGTAAISARKDIPLLRHVVTALALVVLARVMWDPRIMGDGVGTWPILNWLLLGYGVPAAAFFASARQLERRGIDMAPRIADAMGILFTGLLAFFQIHHALHGGNALAPGADHVEVGLWSIVGLGMSYALMRLDLGRANLVFRMASLGIGVLSALIIAFGLGVAANPLLHSEPVAGRTVFSSLLLGYLLPGLAAMLLARAARPYRPYWYVTGLAVLSALLIFGYVTLEVRHAFQGALITFWRPTSAPEQWAYSAAWLWLGLVFLAYGIFRGSIEARLASAALVLLSVVKVFLLDLAGLTGLWRALSFIVLGLVLIGIGLAYQHLVFGNRGPAPAAPQAPDGAPVPPAV